MLSNSQFTRLVILSNPASTHYKRATKRINELRDALPDVPCTTIETSAKGRQASAQALIKHAAKLGPRSLLAIAAGDGTTTMALEALLLAPELAAVRDTPVLPLWGGNANDLAHMLNGPAYRARLATLLQHGKALPIHPLECRLTGPDGQVTTHIAACYASFGATAFAAHRLNQPGHRHSRLHKLPGGKFLQELITVTNAFIEAPPFMLKEAESARIVYERTFANGSRFAGINRLPVKLSDEAFYLQTIEKSKPLTSIRRLTRSLRRKLSDSILHDQADFMVDRDTYAQFDGEAIHIPAGTKVHVQLSEQPFYALTIGPAKPSRRWRVL